MEISFATCIRNTALGFIEEGNPSYIINKECSTLKRILDLVQEDVIRITDPAFHKLAIIPGKNYDSSYEEELQKLGKDFFSSLVEKDK